VRALRFFVGIQLSGPVPVCVENYSLIKISRHLLARAFCDFGKTGCVVPADNAPSLSKDMDITMLTFPGGQERTEPQFRSLLKAAGFELKSITPTTSMISVVDGKPV
jgi:hypothetical protein